VLKQCPAASPLGATENFPVILNRTENNIDIGPSIKAQKWRTIRTSM
jgi:hypothetical protein